MACRWVKSVEIPSSETWTQILFAGIRFVFAGILTILIGSALNRKLLLPTKSSVPSIAKLAVFQTILHEDGAAIRSSAIEAGIPLFTALDTADAMVRVLESRSFTTEAI